MGFRYKPFTYLICVCKTELELITLKEKISNPLPALLPSIFELLSVFIQSLKKLRESMLNLCVRYHAANVTLEIHFVGILSTCIVISSARRKRRHYSDLVWVNERMKVKLGGCQHPSVFSCATSVKPASVQQSGVFAELASLPLPLAIRKVKATQKKQD